MRATETVTLLSQRSSIGMVFSVNVVHHIHNIGDYFRKSFRVLAPGGIFCTATDSDAIINRRTPLSRYWPATVPVELARYHDLEKLRGEMAALEFRGIDAREGSVNFTISDLEA